MFDRERLTTHQIGQPTEDTARVTSLDGLRTLISDLVRVNRPPSVNPQCPHSLTHLADRVRRLGSGPGATTTVVHYSGDSLILTGNSDPFIFKHCSKYTYSDSVPSIGRAPRKSAYEVSSGVTTISLLTSAKLFRGYAAHAVGTDETPPILASQLEEIMTAVVWDRVHRPVDPVEPENRGGRVYLDSTLVQFLSLLMFYDPPEYLRHILVDSIVMLLLILSHTSLINPSRVPSGSVLATRPDVIATIVGSTSFSPATVEFELHQDAVPQSLIGLLLFSHGDTGDATSPLEPNTILIEPAVNVIKSGLAPSRIIELSDVVVREIRGGMSGHEALTDFLSAFESLGTDQLDRLAPIFRPAVAQVLLHRLESENTGDSLVRRYITGAPNLFSMNESFLLVCASLTLRGYKPGSPHLRTEAPGIATQLSALLENSTHYDHSELRRLLSPSEAPVVTSDSGTLYVYSPRLCLGIIAAATLPLATYFVLSIVYSGSSSLGNLASVFLLLSGVILGTGPAYVRRGWQYYDFLRLRLPAAYTSDANRCLAFFLIEGGDSTVSTVRGHNVCYLPDSLRSPGGNIEADVPVHIVDLLCSSANISLYVDPFRRYVMFCEGKHALVSDGLNHLTDGPAPAGLTPLRANQVEPFVGLIRRATVGGRNVGRGRPKLKVPRPGPAPRHELGLSSVGHMLHLEGQNSGGALSHSLTRPPDRDRPPLPMYGYDSASIIHAVSPLVHYWTPVAVGPRAGAPGLLEPTVDGSYVVFAYSVLGQHARDYYVDLDGLPTSAERFAFLVRETASSCDVRVTHLLRALANWCRQYKDRDGVNRLRVPVYRDSTRRSINRMIAMVAGGPSINTFRLPSVAPTSHGLRSSCMILARAGPTVIGHAVPGLAYAGCVSTRPIVNNILTNAPWIALYAGSWRLGGYTVCSTVQAIHHMSVTGIPGPEIMVRLLDTLQRASADERRLGVMALDTTRPPQPLKALVNDKLISRLVSRLDCQSIVNRINYYAAMNPAPAVQAHLTALRCCYLPHPAEPTPYTPLEYPDVPFLSLDFRVIVNGGFCCPPLLPVHVASRPAPAPYRHTPEEGPRAQPDQPPRSGERLTIRYTYETPRPQNRRFSAQPLPLPAAYTFLYLPYTRYRLLIYPYGYTNPNLLSTLYLTGPIYVARSVGSPSTPPRPLVPTLTPGPFRLY